MDGQILVVIGFGLLVSGGIVCWVALASTDRLWLLAGAVGTGLGAAMVYRGRTALSSNGELDKRL